MSNDAIHWARRYGRTHNLASSDRFVLVTLADYAGDDWRAYPSIRTLAADTGHSTNTVMAALDRLAELGAIVRTPVKMRHSTVWQLDPQAVDNHAPLSRHRRDGVAIASRSRSSDQGKQPLTRTRTIKEPTVSDLRHSGDGSLHHVMCGCPDCRTDVRSMVSDG